MSDDTMRTESIIVPQNRDFTIKMFFGGVLNEVMAFNKKKWRANFTRRISTKTSDP